MHKILKIQKIKKQITVGRDSSNDFSYADELINKKGIFINDTPIKYTADVFQNGGGYITSGVNKGLIKDGDSFKLGYVLYEMIANSDNTAKSMMTKLVPNLKKEILKYSSKDSYIIENNKIKPSYFYDVLNKLYYDKNYNFTVTLMKNAKDYWFVNPSDNDFAKKYGWYDDTISQVGIVYGKRPYMIIIFKSGNGNIDEKKTTKLKYIGNIFYEVNNIN